MPSATPGPLVLITSRSIAWPPPSGVHESLSVPLPGNTKSCARYWSPKPWRATTTGLSQCGTMRGTFLQMIGSRKIVPSRMLRMVPLGLRHICLSPNSLTRPSSGVMVAHLTATPYSLVALAESMVIWSLVSSRFWTDRS